MEIKKLSIPNPTSHVFKLPLNALKDTLLAMFNVNDEFGNTTLKSVFTHDIRTGGDTYGGQVSFTAESAKTAISGKTYFAAPNTGNDVYLHSFGERWNSVVYLKQGKGLEYGTPFIIGLASTDNKNTEVTVKAVNPTVLDRIGGEGAGALYSKEIKVEPTTIEEYAIILYIASKLGDTSLEPIKLP